MRSPDRSRESGQGAAARKAGPSPKRLGAAVSILSLCLSLSGCFVDDIKALAIGDIDLDSVKDGSYEASQENDPIAAKVRVEVKAGRIEAIAILDHSHGPKKGADAIVDEVVAAQSLKVDSISGATLSSKVVLKAIENALEKGIPGGAGVGDAGAGA
jgi:uncharacterized protein with FMN-binding domain